MDLVIMQIKKAKRILIVGCPGVGKTTFAQLLARKLTLPLYSLDNVYIQKNWQRLDDATWHERLAALLEMPEWIIEGNYASSFAERLKYADMVVWLHAPTMICIWRVLLRGVKRLLGERKSLPAMLQRDPNYHVSFSIDTRFLKLVLFYNFNTKRKMQCDLHSSCVPKMVLNQTQRQRLLKLLQLYEVKHGVSVKNLP